ncbi:receptor-interacting serine/threonine-protein kinase 1 isoform X2 [Latimeria chalumnae]|uniref:receptor-interacting serine/threonine-protein kinase 1 isoform X2 n=1 Tax=Latimeria chalumnae TaxID=7897 RepID=UPI0003C1704D|nr:PREDICTED: receptor-interacting serine/threonine-protein kinase 1 isoform X2 [Latimeria chalumnae]|eukprot:XP_006004488.1 PREDICTED: receptor-interacting serine/threonine-protein kinase 1 isoform X2 [Latimeria chalumnae]
MSLDKIIHMSSSELLDKEPLDAGGFGMVSLCCHRSYGLVVLKTVYTGPQRTEYNSTLLEEGKMMCKLSHDRVIKLLGIILEEGNYSLVMEFMGKGNLWKVLQSIADLGVATFKTWSKLTKEENNRLRKVNKASVSKTHNNAGTLSYIAPEHLKSVNTKPSEKSDVYSFGIVIWVILTRKEPYENAMNENQVYHCVLEGNRPDMAEVPSDSPEEISNLMQQCWDTDCAKRPTFVECDCKFRPFYTQRLQEHVNADVEIMKREYPAPKEFVKRLQSLQFDCVPIESMPTDDPNSLHSSQGATVRTVDEALFSPCTRGNPVESEFTVDATEGGPSLEEKLQEESNYHLYGNRMDRPESKVMEKFIEEKNRRVSHDPFKQQIRSGLQFAQNQATPVSERPWNSAVAASTNFSRVNEKSSPRPCEEIDRKPGSTGPPQGHLRPAAEGTGSSGAVGFPAMQNNVFKIRDNGITRTPVPESGMPTSVPGSFVGSQNSSLLKTSEAMTQLYIGEANGIQIGNNNVMSIGSQRYNALVPSPQRTVANEFKNLEVLDLYPIENEHLDLLQDNIAKQWKWLARKLGLTQGDIDEIDHDYDRDGLREKMYQMLQKWKMREGLKGATVGKLARVLLPQNPDLVHQLQRKYHSQDLK